MFIYDPVGETLRKVPRLRGVLKTQVGLLYLSIDPLVPNLPIRHFLMPLSDGWVRYLSFSFWLNLTKSSPFPPGKF